MTISEFSQYAVQAVGVAAMGTLVLGTIIDRTRKNKTDANALDDKTISSLKNSISALELENEFLKKENQTLKEQLTIMQAQILKSQQDIIALKDLATGASAVKELKEILIQFLPIIPMMPQFTKNDEITHNLLNQLLSGQREARTMIQDDFKATNRVERRMLSTPSDTDGSGDQANVSVSIKKRKP